MRNVDMYLNDWMLDSSNGYYANQKDEPEGLPSDWWPQDYWLLDTAEKRLAYGIPPIDHAIYTDKNGEVIRAYVLAAQAFDNPEYLKKPYQLQALFYRTASSRRAGCCSPGKIRPWLTTSGCIRIPKKPDLSAGAGEYGTGVAGTLQRHRRRTVA
ncbi:hypothetical protein [Aliamphritea spongicola]|nr:hypothetical protein [Aliamphritea spongicola]